MERATEPYGAMLARLDEFDCPQCDLMDAAPLDLKAAEPAQLYDSVTCYYAKVKIARKYPALWEKT